MNLDTIGTSAEIIGAGAVVISLVYLAIQIRETNAATREEAAREIQNLISQFLAQVSSDTEITKIWVNGMLDLDELSNYEKYQYRSMLNQINSLFERMYRLKKQNRLENWIWDSNIKVFHQMIASPGFKSWFTDRSFVLNDDWRDFLEREMANATHQYVPLGVSFDQADESADGT